MFFFGALNFWRINMAAIIQLCVRHGMILMVSLGALDIATSYFFGDPQTIASVGYMYFLEKSTFAFVYSAIYLFYCLGGGNRLMGLSWMIAYFLISQLANLGILFNASTGLLVFIIFFVCTFIADQAWLKTWLLTGFYLSLLVVLAVGVIHPQLFSFDHNSWWRVWAWQLNLRDLLHTHLVGVGFGTPYHRLITQNLLDVPHETYDSISVGSFSAIDVQYFRTQHSSFVNVFYRLGLVGGLIFAYLNVHIWRIAMRLVPRLRDRTDKNLVVAALGNFLVALTQISVHVGIETPRVLIIYVLSAALPVYLGRLALAERHREAEVAEP